MAEGLLVMRFDFEAGTAIHSIAIAVTLVLVGNTVAQGEVDWQAARRDKEAAVLFSTIIRDLPEPPITCEIDGTWSTYGVSYDIAHKAIGLNVHADLANPWPIATPAVVIGSAVAKDVICDQRAREKEEALRIAAWQATFKALPKGTKPPLAPSFFRRSFSYPLFDETFHRAVLMRQGEGFTARFDDKGEQLRSVPEGGGSAIVYRRGAKGWKKVDELEVYSAD